MTISLSTDVLSAAGYGKLTAQQASGLLSDLHSALEALVGYRLAEGLADEEFDELNEYMTSGDEQAASAWLERRIPGYKKVVQDAYDELLHDLTRIAASSGTQSDGRS